MPEDRDQPFGCVDAVLQRYHRSPRPDDVPQLSTDAFDVPQFDAEQNEIDGPDTGDVVGHLGRSDTDLVAVAFDPQSVRADRGEMRTARDKRHIRPGFGERSAIGPADAPRADHGDAHAILRLELSLSSTA